MKQIPIFSPPTPDVSSAFMAGVQGEAPSFPSQIWDTVDKTRKAIGSTVGTAVGLPLGAAEMGINLLANIAAAPSTLMYKIGKGLNTTRTKFHRTLSGETHYSNAA